MSKKEEKNVVTGHDAARGASKERLFVKLEN